jgi:hypothetical protein
MELSVFSSHSELREEKKITKNIFLPTSEFGRSKIFLF